MDLLWFDRVFLPETLFWRFWWFALRELSAVISLRVRPWPRPWSRTPLWRSWIWIPSASTLKSMRPGVSGGEVFALLGARVRGLPENPTSRVLHKPPSKGHSGPPKHVMQRPSKVFMIQFPGSTWEMDKFGSIFSMERYQCMLLIHFQAGDHSPRFKRYNARSLTDMSRWWNILDRAASAQSGGVAIYLLFPKLTNHAAPHCEVDSVNLEWNRNSQWEREKPWKRP